MYAYEAVMINNLRAGIYKLKAKTQTVHFESNFFITPNDFKRELRCNFAGKDDGYINSSLAYFKYHTRILDVSNSGLK